MYLKLIDKSPREIIKYYENRFMYICLCQIYVMPIVYFAK